MKSTQPNNPLHGLTLETILRQLVDWYGWQELGTQINIRCFNEDPGISSSLKSLRTTAWARDKVEALYLTDPSLEGHRIHGGGLLGLRTR